jgi:hypothetical protein
MCNQNRTIQGSKWSELTNGVNQWFFSENFCSFCGTKNFPLVNTIFSNSNGQKHAKTAINSTG